MKSHVLRMVTVIFCLVVLAACGAAPTTPSTSSSKIVTELTNDVTVTYWHTLTDHHEEALLKLIDKFNATHDHIKVEAQARPLTDFQSQVSQAVRNGTGPNMINGYPNFAATFIENGQLVDFAPYLKDEKVGYPDMKERVNPGVFKEATQWGDKMYLIPSDQTGEVLFYNKTIYDKLGLQAPKTWEQLAENSRKITKETGKPAFGFDSLTDGALLLIMQNGGSVIDPKAKKSTINSDVSRKAFEQLLPLYKEGVYRLVGEDQFFSNPFGAQAVYSYIGSSAGIGFIEQAIGGAFELGIAPVPQVDGGVPYVNSWGGFGMAFNGTPEENLASYEFLSWALMTPDVAAELSSVVGAVPASLEAQQTPLFSDYAENTPVIKVLQESLKNVGYQPAVIGSNETREAVGRAAELILLGKSSIDDALAEAERTSNKALAG